MRTSAQTLRSFLGAMTSCAAMMMAPGMASAQGTYPTRPVTIIVPAPAGAGIDLIARVVGEKLSVHSAMLLLLPSAVVVGQILLGVFMLAFWTTAEVLLRTLHLAGAVALLAGVTLAWLRVRDFLPPARGESASMRAPSGAPREA